MGVGRFLRQIDGVSRVRAGRVDTGTRVGSFFCGSESGAISQGDRSEYRNIALHYREYQRVGVGEEDRMVGEDPVADCGQFLAHCLFHKRGCLSWQTFRSKYWAKLGRFYSIAFGVELDRSLVQKSGVYRTLISTLGAMDAVRGRRRKANPCYDWDIARLLGVCEGSSIGEKRFRAYLCLNSLEFVSRFIDQQRMRWEDFTVEGSRITQMFVRNGKSSELGSWVTIPEGPRGDQFRFFVLGLAS